MAEFNYNTGGYDSSNVQVQFNPGLDVALEVSKIIKRCEYFCRTQNYSAWHTELEILRRRLYAKSEKDPKGKEELMGAREKGGKILRTYFHESSIKGKSIPFAVENQFYSFLISYEEVLRKYASKYGYDNPDKDDPSSAIMRK